MFEISNIKPINKGSMVLSCNARVTAWGVTLNNVTVMQKGTSRWVSLPSREVTSNTGERKFYDILTFDSASEREDFKNALLKAIDTQKTDEQDEKIVVANKPTVSIPF
jgi:DNA-binding cell septation regulator SpoVG